MLLVCDVMHRNVLVCVDDKTAAQEFEEELADYNGDDENEPEFEADKQKELAEV